MTNKSATLMVLPPHPSGDDWLKAARLVRPTVALRLVATRTLRPPPPRLDDDAGGPHVDLAVTRLRPSRFFWRLNARLAARSIGRSIAMLEDHGYHVDLVHGHFYSHSAALPDLKERHRLPYVVTEHSTALTFENPTKSVTRAGRRLARMVYESADLALPVSNFLAEAIRQLGLPGPLRVVSNPIDPQVFFPAPDWREPVHDEAVRMVTVSALTPVKRLDLLLESLARARARIPNLRLMIVGSGPLQESLAQRTRQLGIAEAIEFAGKLDRQGVAERLRQSHFYVSATATENLPVSILEALACGLPVIAPAVGGVPELVDEHVGIVYESGRVDLLTHAILRMTQLLPATKHRAHAVERARERSIDRVGEQLGRIYAEVLANSAAA